MFLFQVLLYGAFVATTLFVINVVCPVAEDQLVDSRRN